MQSQSHRSRFRGAGVRAFTRHDDGNREDDGMLPAS